MIIELPKQNKNKLVARYEIEAGNNVTFKVELLENGNGDRSFDIIASQNASDDYTEVFNHPFYKDFVLPWVYKEKNLSTTSQEQTNVVNFSDYRKNKNK